MRLTLQPGDWFVIRTGPHRGRWHLSGWQKMGWKLMRCPLCAANVQQGQQWDHEEWHSRIDCPYPSEEERQRSMAEWRVLLMDELDNNLLINLDETS